MSDKQKQAIMYLLHGNVNAITAICEESSFADIENEKVKAVCSHMLDTYLYLANEVLGGRKQ